MSDHNAILTGGVWCPNNGKLPSRADSDVYLTPKAVVEVAYQFLKEQAQEFLVDYTYENGATRALRILDLGAGPGAWGEVARNHWFHAFIQGVELRGVEKHPAYNLWSQMEMQQWHTHYACEPFDLVIGNPPYCLAEQAVRIGLERVREGGYVMQLLPITFLTSQGRRDGLFNEYPLYSYAQYSQRISWIDNGKTPPRDHALYLWKKGWEGPWEGHFLPNTK
jgi:hypothetical protein